MAEVRAFICFELPEEVKEELKRVQNLLKARIDGVSWVRPEGIHLTLKFLGDIPVERIDETAAAMEGACRGESPMTMTLSELGAFPNLKRPRVYWAGIEEPSGRLSALQKKLDGALAELGFEREARPFSPHLTLGRVKRPEANLGREALAGCRLETISFTPADAVLMKSDLRPSGAVYTPLRRVALQSK